MSQENALFLKTLKEHKKSVTPPRKLLFSTLQNHNASSINNLLSLMRPYDRATIYRTVRLFEKLNIIRRVYIGNTFKLELSDTFHHHHHHFSCSKCGRLIIIKEDNLIEKNIQELARTNNFTISDHQIEVHGLCSDCLLKS